MIILQRCPKCGSAAERSFRVRGGFWQRLLGFGWIYWFVHCQRDPRHAHAEGATEEAAATAWNSKK